MSILGGVACALVLVTIVIIVTMRIRCNHPHSSHHGHIHHHHGARNGSHDNTWKTDSGCENSSLSGTGGSAAELHQQADLEIRTSRHPGKTKKILFPNM